MQPKRTLKAVWLVVPALVASLALAGAPRSGEPEPDPAPDGARGPVAAASSSEDGASRARDGAAAGDGVRVHLDPLTGEILSRPAEPDAADAVAEDRPAGAAGPRGWLNTYGDDLVQEPLPGGGYKVDLRGRFQSSVVATIDPDTGAVEVDCVRSPEHAEAADER